MCFFLALGPVTPRMAGPSDRAPQVASFRRPLIAYNQKRLANLTQDQGIFKPRTKSTKCPALAPDVFEDFVHSANAALLCPWLGCLAFTHARHNHSVVCARLFEPVRQATLEWNSVLYRSIWRFLSA